MNNARRKAIDGIVSDVQTVLDEEQDYFDNMPESLQYNSQRGETATQAIEALEYAMSNMQEVIDNLNAASE